MRLAWQCVRCWRTRPMLSHRAKCAGAALVMGAAVLLTGQPLVGQDGPPRRPLRVDPQPVASDKSVKYDYDIVYVRAPRTVKGGDGKQGGDGTERLALVWPDARQPFNMRASTDLMLLPPDGRGEMLVAGAPGAIADPYVSFDAQWVYYTHFHDTSGQGGADVYKVDIKTRKTVRLTHQEWTPNA